jgi:hypothetical protein
MSWKCSYKRGVFLLVFCLIAIGLGSWHTHEVNFVVSSISLWNTWWYVWSNLQQNNIIPQSWRTCYKRPKNFLYHLINLLRKIHRWKGGKKLHRRQQLNLMKMKILRLKFSKGKRQYNKWWNVHLKLKQCIIFKDKPNHKIKWKGWYHQ